MKNIIGFGIAGNFAHHLDQAGESSDFVNVETEEENAPKGIFPFYLPQSESFLGTYPLSNDTIVAPRGVDGNLQLEPEMGILWEIEYEGERVKEIKAKKFFAYNDCSIRKEGAKKISEKKNWGENTKGISATMLDIDSFSKGGVLDSFHIASFLRRNGEVYEYGEDSAVSTYNYFYEKLQNWIIEKLNNQKDFGPLEDLHSHLKNSNFPKEMIISIGATSYTEFGENNFLEVGDEVFVFVYDSNKYTLEEIKNSIDKNELENCSKLHQKIV
jgi:hypothetical protein